jgi:hypothetical protein
MADRRDKFHLLPCQPLCACCGYKNHCDACGEDAENTEADREISTSQLSHCSIQRSSAVNSGDLPGALIDDCCSDACMSLYSSDVKREQLVG